MAGPLQLTVVLVTNVSIYKKYMYKLTTIVHALAPAAIRESDYEM